MFARKTHIRAHDYSGPGTVGGNALERKAPQAVPLFESGERKSHPAFLPRPQSGRRLQAALNCIDSRSERPVGESGMGWFGFTTARVLSKPLAWFAYAKGVYPTHRPLRSTGMEEKR
jgi:hypothetical protein